MTEVSVERRAELEEMYRCATDAEKARWIRISEHSRANPGYLPDMASADPGLHRRVQAGIAVVQHRITRADWRDPILGGRPAQLLPGTERSFSDRTDGRFILGSGGRGGGKSRLGSEGIKELLYGTTWTADPRVSFIGRTLDAARTEMFLNGFIPLIPRKYIRRWVSTICELEIYVPGGRVAHIKGYSSAAPDKLRGPNIHMMWMDEFAAFADADRGTAAIGTTFSNANFTLREAHRDPQGRAFRPRAIITTTPRPVRGLRNHDLTDPYNPGLGLYDMPETVVSKIPTLDNLRNLSPEFWEVVIRPLVGTRLFDQEVMGELIDAHPGALWSLELVDQMRSAPGTLRTIGGGIHSVVVGVDPTVGSGQIGSDECGIVVCGLANDGCVYVLADRSMRAHPAVWAKAVVQACRDFGTTQIVAEYNQGHTMVGEMIAHATADGEYFDVEPVHARQGKTIRAGPVALLCDRQLVKFAGSFPELARQLTTIEPDNDSAADDRYDAFVYATSHLMPAEIGWSGAVDVVRAPVLR